MWRSQRWWRKYDGSRAAREGELRREVGAEGQWFHGPEKRNDPFRQGV
jgi:hypothetical protein